MTMTKYLRTRGLNIRLVAQELGVTRQSIAQYNGKKMPRVDTMKRIAAAMTELGAPTTVVELLAGLCDDQNITEA